MYTERQVNPNDPHDLVKCYRCGQDTLPDQLIEIDYDVYPNGIYRTRVYCESCSEKIRHADKYGYDIDQWQARFVE